MTGERFTVAMRELERLFDYYLQPSDKFSLITFNSQVRIAFSMTSKRKNLSLMKEKLEPTRVL